MVLEAQHGTYLRPNPVPSMVSRKVIDFSVALLRRSFPPPLHYTHLFSHLTLNFLILKYVFLDQIVFLSCKFTVLRTRGPWLIIRDLACYLNLKVNYRYFTNAH